jgi:probable phosphomutase (TIGR03848 family)
VGTLLLIRHGRTPANVQGILAGRSVGVELDQVGIDSATALGQRVKVLDVAHVVVSPLERTVQTGELVFANGVQMTKEAGLLECDYGTWQGRSLAELSLEPEWKIVQERPDEMVFPQGESMQAMSDRAIKTIRDWDMRLSQEHGESVIWAAVSHGDIIKAICADALGISLRNFQRLLVDPASVSVIHYGESGVSVSKLNDTGESWISKLGEKSVAPTLGGQSGKEQE